MPPQAPSPDPLPEGESFVVPPLPAGEGSVLPLPWGEGRGEGVPAHARAWRHSLLSDHAIFRLAWTNLAEVIPGRLYRANHPTPGRLARYQRELGLRTVVNLRGTRPSGSLALSRHAAGRLGLVHIDMDFESRGAPQRDRILRFAAAYRSMTMPALLHCKSGADRAGLAAGLALLFEGHGVAQALRQLSWRYGHFRGSRTGVLDAFFALYAAEAEGRVPFLRWVEHDYDEEALRRGFRAGRLYSFVNDRLLARE